MYDNDDDDDDDDDSNNNNNKNDNFYGTIIMARLLRVSTCGLSDE